MSSILERLRIIHGADGPTTDATPRQIYDAIQIARQAAQSVLANPQEQSDTLEQGLPTPPEKHENSHMGKKRKGKNRARRR